MKKLSYHKDGVTRTEANRIIRRRNKKWNTQWGVCCMGTFLVATLLYWFPPGALSFVDNAHTAVNILLAMSTSGMVMLVYRIPKIRNMDVFALEKMGLIIVGFCITINVLLSIPPHTKSIGYFTMVVTGIGTGDVALIFAAFDKYLEEADKNDRDWIKRCPRNKA